MREPDTFSAIYVLDSQGNVVASSSGSPPPQAEILKAYRSFSSVGMLTLFQRESSAAFPPLAIIAPVETPNGTHNQHPVSGGFGGAVVLVTRPEVLRPLFLTDISTTASGETLFVSRREGEAVFVSPFRSGTQKNRPAVPKPGDLEFLALDRQVFGEYRDYQGVPVLAVTRYVPELGWGMVTKIDCKEALTRFHQTVINGISILLVSLGALVSLCFAFWRHHQVHGLRGEIARRRQAEEELQQSERRFFTAFRSSPEGMSITTLKDGRYIEANDVFLRTLGYQREEVIGKTSVELGIWARAEDRAAMIEKLTCGELVREMELNAKTKSGQIRQVLLSLETIRLQEEVCLLASLRDTTEQRLLEERFRQAQKMEAIGRLAGGVAHDFNNLLMLMMGYSELLLERLADSDPNRKTVEHIFDAGRRAAEVTRQLLAFSRRQVLHTRVVELKTVVRDAQKLLQRLVGEDIEIVMRLGPHEGYVKADPGQIVQVIMNLAVNSRDAMPEGGRLTIETANVVVDDAYAQARPPLKSGAYTTLVVSDTGCGMDENTKSHLFEPFFTTKEVGKGTGLGLSTVYGIIKQSGGFIWVESMLCEGTTISIYLPQVTKPEPSDTIQKPRGEIVGGSETILIAEDEASLRQMTRHFLEAAGYRVLEATDGYDAINIMKANPQPIHMLLTDVVMPKMNGPMLAQKIRELTAGTPVIYVSGYTDNSLLQRALLEDHTGFLQKPYSRRALLDEIHRLFVARKLV